MSIITTIGLDLAKSIFQVHAVDGDGAVVLRRSQLLDFFRHLPSCLVGMEACPALTIGLARSLRAATRSGSSRPST